MVLGAWGDQIFGFLHGGHELDEVFVKHLPGVGLGEL